MTALRLFSIIVFICLSTRVMATPTMYVPTGSANDIIIIDLEKDAIIGRIDELENAHGLSSSAQTEYLIAGSMQVVDETPIASKPAAVSEAEHQAHHAADNGQKNNITTPSYVSIVHPQHGHVMRRVAVRGLTHHTAVSPDGRVAVAVHSGAGGISLIDIATDKIKVIKTLQTGAQPNYAIFSPDGRSLFVSNAGPGTVSWIDSQDWSVQREIKVGKRPEHMAITPGGDALFVANVDDGTVSVIDLVSASIVENFQVGPSPHGVAVSADGAYLFASSKDGNRLSRIDLASGKTQAIDLDPAPYHVTYVEQTNKLYVASRKQPLIWVINPTTLAIEKNIDIGKGVAHQMVVKESD